jgi:hypothetical protein
VDISYENWPRDLRAAAVEMQERLTRHAWLL